jgi:hypothetical protein
MNPILKKVLPHLGALAIFMVLAAAYFSPQISGKMLPQSDIMQYKGMAQELTEYKEKTGETTLWTNSMFGGMPTYQIKSIHSGNNFYHASKVYRLFVTQPIGRFFAAMLSFYILMMVLGGNFWVSIAAAIGFGFTTNNFLLFEAGHTTKLSVLSYLPLLAAGMILTFRRKYLLGGTIFAIGAAFAVHANHPQMAYYFFLTLVIFGIAQFVKDLKNKELPQFAKAVGVLLIGGLLALGSASSNLLVTYEYSQETMRGAPILENENTAPASSSETEGLEWGYAMQWSNGVIDCFSSFIPGLAGGGSQEPVDKSSASFKSLRQQGYNVREPFAAPLYWGKLPFTSGPAYFGAAIILLFLMGSILVKGPVKWWLVLGTLLTFILSMGKNMAFINEFFFNYVPLFNKFRTPNSVLGVTAILVTLLAFLNVEQIINKKSAKEEILRSLYISGGITAAIALFFLLFGTSFFDFVHPQDASRAPFDPAALVKDRQALMQSDSLRSLIIVLVSGGLIWLFVKDKIKQLWLVAGLGLIVLIDLWTVDKRYLSDDDFVNKSKYAVNFKPRQADTQILQDPDLYYRVYDASENTFNSTKTSYFHKSIGGYHAAKLQRFQDIIDRHITKGNQQVLDMLNTKYFIMPPQQQGGEARAQQNPGAMGNAWFVSTLKTVANANEEIDALNEIDPKNEAVVHQEFADYIAGLNPQKNGSIVLTDYKPDQLTYQSSTTSDQFAVFSEVWYGPGKGWEATIDGQPAEFVRVNYILRGMKVPAGEHTIVFKFDPQMYRVGTTLSFIFSSIILLAFLYVLYQKWTVSKAETKQKTGK